MSAEENKDQLEEQMESQGLSFDDEQFGSFFDTEGNNEELVDATTEAEFDIDPDFYRPSLRNKNVEDNVYQSRIRYMPDPMKLPTTSHFPMVYLYYLPDPDNPDRQFVVTCTSNERKGKKNIISEAYFTLKDSPLAVMRNIAKRYFMRRQFWYTYVLVELDKQQPEEVGKVKIMRIGKQIMDKIEQEKENNPNIGKTPVYVNHFTKGKDMILVIKEETIKDDNTGKTKKITSYNASYFDGNISTIPLSGIEQRIGVEPTTEEINAVKKLYEGVPNLVDKVSHKPWDQELEKKVIRSVRYAIDDDEVFDKIYRKIYGAGYNFEADQMAHSRSERDKAREESGDTVTGDFNVTAEDMMDESVDEMEEVTEGMMEESAPEAKEKVAIKAPEKVAEKKPSVAELKQEVAEVAEEVPAMEESTMGTGGGVEDEEIDFDDI